MLGHTAEGSDNLKIAACLNVCERTVKAHVTGLHRKLGPQNRAQIALLGRDLGVQGSVPFSGILFSRTAGLVHSRRGD